MISLIIIIEVNLDDLSKPKKHVLLQKKHNKTIASKYIFDI